MPADDGSGAAAYADPGAIVAEAFEGLIPPERDDVASWAAKHRFMPGMAMRWLEEKTPYTVQPARSLTSRLYTTVAAVGPGQVAKTVIAENWLAFAIETEPADFLWYMQSNDGLESYVKGRINPLIDEHEQLRRKLGLRAIDDSIHFKRFRGMSVEFLPFGERTIINKSAVNVVADEIDNYQWLGNVKPVLDIRRQAAQQMGRHTMLFALSHPDMAEGHNPAKHWSKGIMAIYADSTRRLWYWRCPRCGAVSSPCPTAERMMTLEYPSDPDVPLEVVAREARLVCPVKGCKIADGQREAMNLDAFRSPWGGWIGVGQEISEGGKVRGDLEPNPTDGFWFVGAMSPFVMGGIGGLARERVKAERDYEVSGEVEPLKQVHVKQWGFCFERPKSAGTVEAATLVERAEPALTPGQVANGVRFLVLAVDVQKWGFEYLVRGFGVEGESWAVETGRILADPATSAVDWDKLIALFERRFPLADDSGRSMAIRAFAFDSGGEAGVTLQAYGAWLRWRRQGKIRYLGRAQGRDIWTVLPLRGASALAAKKLVVNYPDTDREAGQAAGGQVPQGLFNPNLFKDDLNTQLLCAEPGRWYVHVPAAFRAKAPPHPWFEQLVAEARQPDGRWKKISTASRNEALDLMVMSHVMAHLFGVHRIDWANPPSWAAPWDDNPFVGVPGSEEPPGKSLASQLA